MTAADAADDDDDDKDDDDDATEAAKDVLLQYLIPSASILASRCMGAPLLGCGISQYIICMMFAMVIKQ